MQLEHAIAKIDTLSASATIFAERINGEFSPQSRVEVIELTDNELIRPITEIATTKAPGTEYFLEVSIVREFLAEWKRNHGSNPSLAAAVAAIIGYSENDA